MNDTSLDYGQTGTAPAVDQTSTRPILPSPNPNPTTRSLGSYHLHTHYTCEHCGKEYSTPHHLENHQRLSCNESKRTISELLINTKEFWATRKKRCLDVGTAENGPAVQASVIHAATPSSATVTVPWTAIRRPEMAKSVAEAAPEFGGRGEVATNEATVIHGEGTPPRDDLNVPISKRKGRRERRRPARYGQEDTVPQALPAVEPVEGDAPTVEPPPAAPKVRRRRRQPMVVHKSKPNDFGILRVYRIPRGSTLTHNSDKVLTLKDLTNSKSTIPTDPPYNDLGMGWGPFSSKSAFSLADWYWHSKNKSLEDFQRLISIFKQRDFSLGDTLAVDWKAAFHALGANQEDLSEPDGHWIRDDGWKKTPIAIDVPLHNRMRKPGCESYVAGDFYHRSIVSVIKEKISCPKDYRSFHYQPYKATWKPTDDAPEVELYGELYTSRAFREANEAVQALPITDINEGLEHVVVAMMFWTDGTQLTSFGGASLWPCYLFFGNESKYRRCQPSEHLGEQIAYFIKLPDTFDDYLHKRNDGKLPTDGLFTHCARELFQKQWGTMLDDELIDAMKRGLVLLTLVAGLRNNGGCPCHRCLVEKDAIWKLASPEDTEHVNQLRDEEEQREQVSSARDEITAGFAVDGKRIDLHLKSHSYVPVHNAFSSRLSEMYFKILPALVVDLMHEFEIGVWKRLFAHLIRLLEAFASLMDRTLTADLDFRYRNTPAFGRDSIRSFGTNASEMKRKAARDYEDLLQCSIPAFESLLPEPHNSVLMKLLYIYAQWHALAKLRMHHDLTLQLLDYTTVWLGAQTRLFNHTTCRRITTKELRREAETREKREGKGKGGGSNRKPVKFNIFTIKFHFLGDYTESIRSFGTTDSFSTETGELFHRVPKSWFERTDRRAYESQLSQVERRHTRLDQIRHENAPTDSKPSNAGSHRGEAAEIEHDRRYAIGVSQNCALSVSLFANDPELRSKGDPYLVDFMPKLKEHLFHRIVDLIGFSAGDFPEGDWTKTTFHNPYLYSHQLMHINYTAYDVRRDQDIVHVGTPQCNVMLLNESFARNPMRSSVHPYLYAKVLGIYHANVVYIGILPDGTKDLSPRRIDFVWVRWYDLLEAEDDFSLDRVSLQPLDADEALGFVDPADILRSVHLIPQFTTESQVSGKHKSGVVPAPVGKTYDVYYINKFADRDLFMRYQYGMAVGHTYMRRAQPRTTSIPADFDYHLTFPDDGPTEEEQGDDWVEPGSDDSDGGSEDDT